MYVINDGCISCGSCADTCPNNAIAMDDDVGHYVISEDCLDCGSCADACPMGVISAG